MRYLVILLALFVLGLGSDAQNSAVPYIHYYDYLRGGLVIERADGTDSRLIPDLIHDGHNAALAPEWSASGKWFASKTYERGNQPQPYFMGLQVISTDGATRYDLGLSEEGLMESQWSPTQDILLVMSGDSAESNVRFWLWNVENQSILAEFTLPDGVDLLPTRWNISMGWTTDGRQAQALWDDQIVTLSPDGAVDYQGRVVIIDVAPLPEITEFVAPSGAATGYLTNPPEVRMIDGEIMTFFPHSYSTASMQTPVRYRWSEDSAWGFIDYDIVLAGGGETPIASVLFNRLYGFQRELPVSGEARFLPDHAIAYLGAGEPQTVLQEPEAVMILTGQFALVGWHPTDPDQFVVYSDEDGLVFWSMAEGMPQPSRQVAIALPLISDYPVGQVLHWLPDQDRVAVYVGGEMVSFDLTTGNSEPLSDFDGTVLGMGESTTAVLQHAQTGEQFSFDESVDITAGDIGGDLAVLGGVYGCCIRVFEAESGALIDQFYGTAYSLALSPDGRWLATTSAGKVSLWDMSGYLP